MEWTGAAKDQGSQPGGYEPATHGSQARMLYRLREV